MHNLPSELSEPSRTLQRNSLLSTIGKTIAFSIGGLGLVLVAGAAPFITPALRKICLPYVPATTQQIENILKGLKFSELSAPSNKTVVDLGSGDGRIVIATALAGYKSTGVELNPWLVAYSRFNTFRQGLSSSARFIRKNLWKVDLTKYNHVIIFGVDEMMVELDKKLKEDTIRNPHFETKTVIACRFPLPNRTPALTIGQGIDTVWIYKLNPQKS